MYPKLLGHGVNSNFLFAGKNLVPEPANEVEERITGCAGNQRTSTPRARGDRKNEGQGQK